MMGTKLWIGPALAALALLGACATSPDALAPGVDDEFGVGGDRPPSVRTLHTMSRVLANQGRDGQCELVLLKLLEEDPCFLPAYLELAELHLRNNRTQSAVEVLERALEHGSEDPVIQNDLGMAYLLNGDHGRAVDSFTAASELAPDEARHRSNLAMALGMLGFADEALSVYLEVIPAADAHYNVAVLLEARGETERAAEEFLIAEAMEKGCYEEGECEPEPEPEPAAGEN